MAIETSRIQYAENDPRDYTAKLKEMLSQTVEQAREHVQKIKDPRGRALLEVTAEVLEGLKNAFYDYEEKSEAAWH
jgi:hypothetical protein